MKKLIEKSDKLLLSCDNPKCNFNYEVPNISRKYLFAFIGTPCPECGENLLTEKDHQLYINYMRAVDFINRWFSWITIFIPNKKTKMVEVRFHDRVKIS